jgi:hypothetical protein
MNAARRKEIKAILKVAEDLKGRVESLKEDEQEAHDNFPESLQGSERGTLAESAIDSLDSAAQSLDEVIAYLEEASA